MTTARRRFFKISLFPLSLSLSGEDYFMSVFVYKKLHLVQYVKHF